MTLLYYIKMNIVLAIDSFKGSLSSVEAEDAARLAIKEIYPESDVVSLPVSDGGEGMMQALSSTLRGRFITVMVHDPLMRPVEARYFVSEEGTVVIEMAEASGLTLLQHDERNPLKTTTYGMGELIADALNKGCRKFIIGIGGSATNDAGLGMMEALGARPYTERQEWLAACGENLEKIVAIDLTGLHSALKESSFEIACDVSNPFCGPEGAARVFGPQKGATAEQVERLESGMNHIAFIINLTTGVDVRNISGAGAAGGIGGAFIAFLKARLRSGIDLILDAVHLESYLKTADLVITGEGKADRQTLMGKVPSGVLKRAQKHDVPVFLIAGLVEDGRLLKEAGFSEVIQITPHSQSLSEAMQPEIARKNIKDALTSILIAQNFYLFG